GAVWYDIVAFSRPQQLLVRLAYPLARRLQRRVARGSTTAVQRAVVEGNSTAPVESDYLPGEVTCSPSITALFVTLSGRTSPVGMMCRTVIRFAIRKSLTSRR